MVAVKEFQHNLIPDARDYFSQLRAHDGEKSEDLNKQEELSPGKLSTIGNILNAWKMHEEALIIFKKKLDYFPDKIYTWDQIGVCNLYLGNLEEARSNFNQTLQLDPGDPKAKEYLRLLDRMK